MSEPPALRVLYRDDLVLAVNKPAGALSVPGRTAQEPSMAGLAKALAKEALPVHRLDRGTSGVLLFALGAASHRALNVSFESRKADKVYLCLVRGALAAPVRCEAALSEARKGGMRVDPAGKPARTDFTPLERFAGFTWVEARPHTGRMHQIRVHLLALGHALAFDERYGEPGDTAGLLRTPLHAASIRVPHPSGRGWLAVEAPLPDDLRDCLARLRAERRGA